jgi:hypothetical protein
MTLRTPKWLFILLFSGMFIGCDGSSTPNGDDERTLTDGGTLLDADIAESGNDVGVVVSDTGFDLSRAINSILPNRVPKTGDSEVRLIGLGFSDDMTVNIGSLRCGQLELQSETQATCIVPELPVGQKDLIIRWTGTGHVRELVDGVEVYEPLVLTGIQPNRAHVSGGQLAWVSGAGFTETARAFIGGARAEIVRVVDNGQSIRIQIPEGTPGLGDVRVENINGRAVLEDGFEFFEPLALTEITPRVSGPEGLDRVILRGVGLGETSEVWFGDVRAEVISSLLQRRRIDVRIPPTDAVGLVDVVVENLGQRALMEQSFVFVGEAEGSPSLSHVVPNRIPVNTFSTIYLAGHGFTSNLVVTLADRDVECDVTSVSVATCVVNELSPGMQNLMVSDASTGLSGEVVLEFFVDVEVFTISPEYGSQAGGTLIEIEGVGFSEDTEFKLGEVPVEVLSVTATSMVGKTGPSQPGLADLHAVGLEDSAILVGAFEYLNPVLSLGGVTGDDITNNLNVTIVDAYTSEALIGAQVIVQGISTGQLWRSRTDDRGQVTFGDEDLSLPVSVTAAYPGYFTETLNRVTSEDTTLLMIPSSPPESESSSGEGNNEPPPVIRGTLEGLSSLKKPDEDGVTVVAFVESSSILDGFGLPFNPISEPLMMLEDGPFEFVVEPGEFAVVGIAGYVETATIESYESGRSTIEDLRKSLQPIQMGMVRHVMVDMGDERDNLTLRLTVPMRQATRVEFDNPPGGTSGPNRFTLDVVLDLQSDGYYDLRFYQSLTVPSFDFGTLPDLSLLQGVRFSWTGDAIEVPLFSIGGVSANPELRTRSTSWMVTDRNMDDVLIGPFVGTIALGPRPLVPTQGIEVNWEAHDGYYGRQTEVADCHFIVFYKDYEPAWISVVPGAASEIELPLLLAGEGAGEILTSSDTLHVMIESYLFSSHFSYSDFSLYDVLGMGSFDSTSLVFSQL